MFYLILGPRFTMILKFRFTVKILNSVDSDQTALKEQSDQDLHCLPFFLHLLEALLQCKIKLFNIKDNYGSWSGCPNI